MNCLTVNTLIFYFLPLVVLSELTIPTATSLVALQGEGPLAPCNGFGLCQKKDDGGVMFGETMEEHLFPPSIWIELNGTRYNAADPSRSEDRANSTLVKIGDSIVYDKENIPKLRSGILSTFISSNNINLFSREIYEYRGSIEPGRLGALIVQAPVQDPDTLFQSLAQNPLLTGIPTGLRPEVDPVISADVFYFSPEPTNTACLSAIKSLPRLPITPPNFMDPSSVYVVYQSIQIFDNCRHWVRGNPPFTASFRSETLSTLEYKTDAPPATKMMNYAELPCPPPDIAQYLKPEVPYSPLLRQLFRSYASLNNDAPALCEQVAVIDPPVRAVRVDQLQD
ncbi:MAG: hypothetical protein Q9198_002436 [Flavoplaca austrocitrina]